MSEWISEPNKCNGCPIEKEQWLEFKLSHCCESDEWEIVHKMDEMGKIICHLTSKEKIARNTDKAKSFIRTKKETVSLSH